MSVRNDGMLFVAGARFLDGSNYHNARPPRPRHARCARPRRHRPHFTTTSRKNLPIQFLRERRGRHDETRRAYDFNDDI